MKIKPFITSVIDYHDFKCVIKHFKNAGIYNIKYEEVGFWDGEYQAIFYTNRKSAEKLIKEKKKYYQEYWS